MKLISPSLHAKLIASAEYTRRKTPEAMLTKVVPVNAVVAKEIGIELETKVAKALEACGKNTSIVQQTKLSDYIDALAAYEPDEPDEPDAVAPAPPANAPKPRTKRRS